MDGDLVGLVVLSLPDNYCYYRLTTLLWPVVEEKVELLLLLVTGDEVIGSLLLLATQVIIYDSEIEWKSDWMPLLINSIARRSEFDPSILKVFCV